MTSTPFKEIRAVATLISAMITLLFCLAALPDLVVQSQPILIPDPGATTIRHARELLLAFGAVLTVVALRRRLAFAGAK